MWKRICCQMKVSKMETEHKKLGFKRPELGNLHVKPIDMILIIPVYSLGLNDEILGATLAKT